MTIANLFGKSPITPIQTHMNLVASAVRLLPQLFTALKENNQPQLQKIADEICAFEHAADLAKQQIRLSLPKNLFLPVDRLQLIEIVDLSDKMADRAEDIAFILSIKKLPWLPSVDRYLFGFLEKNIEAFEKVKEIIDELHELAEFSFGGVEGARVKQLVKEAGILEHEADLLQKPLLAAFFEDEKELTFSTFHLWQQVFQALGALSNLSENLALRVPCDSR